MSARKPTTWQAIKARVKASTALGRARLIAELGGKCFQCGSTQKLQFHHLRPRYWNSSEVSQWQRLARHRREARVGKLAVACASCNRRIGRPSDAHVYVW